MLAAGVRASVLLQAGRGSEGPRHMQDSKIHTRGGGPPRAAPGYNAEPSVIRGSDLTPTTTRPVPCFTAHHSCARWSVRVALALGPS